MQCVRSGPTAPSVCQCHPDRLDKCAGMIWSFFMLEIWTTSVYDLFVSCICLFSSWRAPILILCLYFLCECVGQTSLSFSGNSYIKYRVTDSGQSGEMRLGLRIRTLQRRGVIMFTRVNPCTMLKVKTFTFKCYTLLYCFSISNPPR